MSSVLSRVWPKLLIGSGTALIFSAVLNVVSTLILFEPTDASSLGISRNEVVSWYGAVLIAGALLIVLGIRGRRRLQK